MTLHPRWPVVNATGLPLEVELRAIVAGQGSPQGEIYLETSTGVFRSSGASAVLVPLSGTDPRVSVKGGGVTEVRVRLVIPGTFNGRIDFDGWLSRHATKTVGRTFMVIRGGGVQRRAFRHGGIAIPSSNSDSVSCAAGDIDGDGDVDIVVGQDRLNGLGPLRILINKGGYFGDEGQQRFPIRSQQRYTAATLGDVDGDGDLDLLLGRHYLVYTQYFPYELWLNDGTGHFTKRDPRFPARALLVSDDETQLVDLDDDGDLDVVLVGKTQEEGLNAPRRQHGAWVYWNNGKGSFGSEQWVWDDVRQLAVGDLNRDGRMDLVFGIVGRDPVVATQSGTHTWSSVTPAPFGNSGAIALLDANDDGWVDLACHSARGSNLDFADPRLFLNTGGLELEHSPGKFPTFGYLSPATHSVVADFDGDRRLDLFVAFAPLVPGHSSGNQIYFNEGGGRFSLGYTGLYGTSSHSLALGDFDGDGDIDVFVPTRSGPDYIVQNLLLD